MSFEDFDEDAPLSDYYGFSVFENCFEDTSSVSEKLFIPHDFNSTIQGVGNAFERLFDGDGIYRPTYNFA